MTGPRAASALVETRAPRPSARLRVGIDAGPLLGEGGISEYVRPLVRTLIARDPDPHYRLILRAGWRARTESTTAESVAPLTRIRVPDRVLEWWWNRVERPVPVYRRLWHDLDAFVATCLVAPVLPHGGVLSILYDLTPMLLPTLFPDRERFRDRVTRLLARSRAVIAISHRTRTDLVEHLGADPERVHVVYPGRRPGFGAAPPGIVADTLARLGIRGRYILYVGSLGPHKNVAALLQAYVGVRRAGGPAVKLVLVGSARWGQETLNALGGLAVRDDVILTGAVAAADLPALYTGADCFVFPSLSEGFGLPVLEAMTCGTPVVVSDRGALPEVVANAGIVVDAEDPTAFAAAIRELLDDPDRRARYARAALARADDFSWDRSADQCRALLRAIAPGGGQDG